MTSIDPGELKPENTKDGNVKAEDVIGEIAPSEDLTLRVEQIFEEAEQLWQWMHND
jgi:hypothetical protein